MTEYSNLDGRRLPELGTPLRKAMELLYDHGPCHVGLSRKSPIKRNSKENRIYVRSDTTLLALRAWCGKPLDRPVSPFAYWSLADKALRRIGNARRKRPSVQSYG